MPIPRNGKGQFVSAKESGSVIADKHDCERIASLEGLTELVSKISYEIMLIDNAVGEAIQRREVLKRDLCLALDEMRDAWISKCLDDSE